MPGFDMSDYVPVNERVEAFLKKHHDGSLQSEIVELTEARVTVKAYAYRTPDDARPGIGHSSLEIPGKTPYTRGSEIENAETSAWGRAIAALGFEVKRGLASAEEVRNKQPQRDERPAQSEASVPKVARTPAAAQRSVEERRLADELLALTGTKGHAYLSKLADKVGVPKGQRANAAQLSAMIDYALEAAGNDAAAEHAATEGPDTAGQQSGPSIQPATAGDAEAAGVSPPPAASPTARTAT